MTEVDYSPEAYDRYRRTQHRIQNWASDTSAHAHQYSHPFQSHQPTQPATAFGHVPDVRPDDSISLYDGGAARRRREHEQHARGGARSRSVDYHAPPSSSSQSRAYAHAQPAQAQQGVYYAAQKPARHASTATAYKTVDLSKHRAGRDVALPALPPGQTYQIIAPKGRRVEVVSPTGAQSYYPQVYTSSSPRADHTRKTSSASSRTAPAGAPTAYTYGAHVYAPAPRKAEKKPLLKRLFSTGVTWENERR